MAKGFLISGWRLRILDENGDPYNSARQVRVEFYDSSTQSPATVYSDVDCTVPIGAYVPLEIDGYVPDNGIWGSPDVTYKALVTRWVDDESPWETLYSINGISASSSVAGASGEIAFSNVAAMRGAVPSTDGAVFHLSGYYSEADGGQGFFVWSAGSYEVDDGGYSFRPNEMPSNMPGRYIRMMQGVELDVRWWGAIPDGVIDCVSPLLNAKAHAQRSDLYRTIPRIAFPASKGYYKLTGSISIGGYDGTGQAHSWRVCAGARFGGFTALTFETDTIFESTGPLAWTDAGGVWTTQPEIRPTASPIVDVRWWAPSELDGQMDGNIFQYVRAPGCSVRVCAGVFPGDVVVFADSVSVSNHLIMCEGVTMQADGVTVTLRSLEVEGRKRQILLGVNAGRFRFSEAGEYPAWVFGWGAGDASGLAFAANCLGASENGCVMIVNGYGVSGNTAPALSSVVSSSLPAYIDGLLKIGAGGFLGVGSVSNAPGTRVFDASIEYPVGIICGISHASWFGTSGQALRQSVNAVSESSDQHSVDLDGRSYGISDGTGIVVNFNGLRIYNGGITASGASLVALRVLGVGFSASEVDFYGENGISALVVIENNGENTSRRGFEFDRCSFDTGNSGAGVQVVSSAFNAYVDDISFIRCEFNTRAVGSFPFLFPAVDLAREVVFERCKFLNLLRQEWVVYGNRVEFVSCDFVGVSAEAAIFRWKGYNGFRFTKNKCKKFGLIIETLYLRDVFVIENYFDVQGVIFIGCMENNQLFNGVLIEQNVFNLSSIGEWPFSVYLNQDLTLNESGKITGATKAFNWSPNDLKLRITGNASNLGQMHQTEVDGIINSWGFVFLRGLIPYAYITHLSCSPFPTISGTTFGSGTYPRAEYVDSAGGALLCEMPSSAQYRPWSLKHSKYGNSRT